MLIDTNKTISVTDANHNFSKLLKKVDEIKEVIIMKRNKPTHVVIEFSQYEKLVEKWIMEESKKLTGEYLEAYKELAKWLYLTFRGKDLYRTKQAKII